jgi:hypothetical protein
MMHCMNCGAPLAGEVCPSCGMGMAAAEAALRRKFANRTAILLLGALSFVLIGGMYPPLELDGMLIFVGVIFFITLGAGLWMERRAARHLEVEILKRIYFALAPVPLLLAGILFVNGGLDHSAPVTYSTKVVSKLAFSGPWPGRRIIVDSWRDNERYERLAVSRTDYDRFQEGDGIVARVESGLIGIPWVSSVYREPPHPALPSGLTIHQ